MAARLPITDLFKSLHFDHEVVILCVRWYLSYKLSSRDLVNILGERGIQLAHTTILRWVQRAVCPGIREALEPVPTNRGRLMAL